MLFHNDEFNRLNIVRTGYNTSEICTLCFEAANLRDNLEVGDMLYEGTLGVVDVEVSTIQFFVAQRELNSDFDTKDPKMTSISSRFGGLEFHHVQHDSNQAADKLARLGTR